MPPFAEPAGSGGAFTGRGLHSQAFVGDASLEDLAEKLARQARTRFEAYSALRYFLVDLVDDSDAWLTAGWMGCAAAACSNGPLDVAIDGKRE